MTLQFPDVMLRLKNLLELTKRLSSLTLSPKVVWRCENPNLNTSARVCQQHLLQAYLSVAPAPAFHKNTYL